MTLVQIRCEKKILNAVKEQFGTTFTSDDIEAEFQFSADVPPGQGTFNLDISVPPQDRTNSTSPGRYPETIWTYISGIGPTLHIPTGPGGLDSPQTLTFSNSQFTAHIDSGFPHNPLGALFHLFKDVFGDRRPRSMSMSMHVIETERRLYLSSALWALFLLLFVSPAVAKL